MRIAAVWLLLVTNALAARAQCPDGSPPPCGPPRAAFDTDLVAVAPFDVLQPSLALWREGLVDVLSRRLDGAGPLRTVSASEVIRDWSGRADPASARRLGRRTHAQFAVFGELIGAGADSVRVSVSVLDVAGGVVTGTAEAHNSAARMDLLADTLTIRLLAVLGRARGLGMLSVADFDTHSLPALRAYLEGEQLFRRAMHDSAAVLYAQAIGIDSGFMQARRRLAWATQWRCARGSGDALPVVDELLVHLAHTRGISLRDSISLRIDSLYAAYVHHGSSDSVEADLLAQLGDVTARAVRVFPRDAEFWHLRGETLERLWISSRAGETARMALAAYEQAIAVDSTLAPPFEDAAELAAKRGDYARARGLLQAYLHAGVSGDCAASASLFADLLPGGLAGAARDRRLRDAAPDQFEKVAGIFTWITDPAETDITLNQIAVERRLIPFPTNDTVRFLNQQLAEAYRFRGRLAAADTAVSSDVMSSLNRIFIERRLTADLPPPMTVADKASINETFAAGLWYVEGLARIRDTTALDRFAQRADSMLAAVPPTDSGEPYPGEFAQRRRTFGYAAKFIRAARALAVGDTSAAIRGLTALPDGACFGCVQHAVLVARLYASLGQYENAAPYYRRDLHYQPDARYVLWAFERATVLERVHDHDGAVDNYRLVVNAWQHPDAELAGYVEQSKQALRRLQ